MIFSASCDVCADTTTFEENIDIIKALIKEYPNEFNAVELEGIYLFGDEKYAESPEIYKELISIFGNKLAVKGG